MGLRIIFKAAAVLCGAVVMAIVAVIANLDLNAYRTDIAAAVEAETGHEVVLGGELALLLGRTTTLVAKDIRIGGASGQPSMLQFGEARAEISVLDLWNGDLVIERLLLNDADMSIAIDKDGRTNFDFLDQQPASDGSNDGLVPEIRFQRVGSVDVRNAHITIRDARHRGRLRSLEFERLRLSDTETETLISIHAVGSMTDDGDTYVFDLSGRTGRISALASMQRPFPVDLKGMLNGVSVAGAGTIADPFAGSGALLRATVATDDLAIFGRLIGEEFPSIGPARLTASLRGGFDRFELRDFDLQLADTKVRGDFIMDLSGVRDRIEGDLEAGLLDLRPWFDPAESVAPDRLLDNARIPFEDLRDFDGDLTVRAHTVLVPKYKFRDAALTLSLENGWLSANPFTARFDSRAFSGDLMVDSNAEPPDVELRLTAQEFDVGRMVARILEEDLVHGTGGADVQIDGQGWSLAEIVGTSTGHVRVLMNAGEVKTGSLGVLVGGVTEIVPSFGDNADWTSINCVAGDFTLENGVATSEVALLDSAILRLVGEGRIDFRDDTLAFEVAPSAKSPTLNVAVPVRLSGPVADPSIAPDELSLLRRFSGLVGAFIFPPAALLTLGTLGSPDNPCLEAVHEAALPTPVNPADTGVDYPEAEMMPEPGAAGADRLIDAVRQLLPLRGDQT